MIMFNKPCVIGEEYQAVQEAIQSGSMSGNGPFSKKSERMAGEASGNTACLADSLLYCCIRNGCYFNQCRPW
ncbi:hypothetical protein RWE15_08055 [Virgibacillus halophilus]|uniref:Uncharacterized protein n=1 Tax=Tigheibacillus halophilus TaxID=361280 RepID=A0ABU5C509_9BACI|nr:hypothetical protein [Virgibacillus halophilus]